VTSRVTTAFVIRVIVLHSPFIVIVFMVSGTSVSGGARGTTAPPLFTSKVSATAGIKVFERCCCHSPLPPE
jgi:hypothetical protein